MTDAAAWPLAQHVCRTGYADLPASAVESARRDILDTFGCMLGGSGSRGIDELFAQPFLVATALAHGKVGIAEVDGLGDAAVLSLSDRIAGVARDHRRRGSLSITVQRTDGRLVTVEASDPIGSPEKPLTNAQLETKFRDCAHNAVQPLSDASVDGLLATIGRLETLPDARELMTAVAR